MGIESPYKFLDFYDIKDQPLFFGRSRESNILVADVVVNRLVVLFARTGTGKTSLINAGVRPLLEARDFRTFYIRVEQNPTEAARDVLQKEKLLREASEDVPLSKELGSIVTSLDKPIVLFFDQFEEFFIQIRDLETRQKFIADIAEAYRDTNSGIHLVFSMREEYFHEMDEFRPAIPSIFHQNSNLRLLHFDETQAREAIIKPAIARNVTMEPTLVDVLVADLVQEGRINPTNLQIVCDTLWRKRNESTSSITLNDYQQLGGWRNILDRRLENDIETALAATDLLSLMQGLIPELRTERNTKYPRVVSDLIKTLGTTETSLRDLIGRLKGIHVIREITVSGALGIEWASDYLAERTEYLLVRVKAIDLKRRLQMAIARAKNTRPPSDEGLASTGVKSAGYIPEDVLEALYMPVDEFEQLSQNVAFLTDLDIESVVFLFDAALFHRSHKRLWFDQATYAKINPWDILQKKIHDKEMHINLRLGTVRLLAELGTEQALVLLGEAMDEPDLALDVVDVLVDISGEQATGLIAKALEREDLWVATLTNLTRTGSERALLLLEPLLGQETKVFQALNSLERLAKSTSTKTGKRAQQALIQAVAHLEPLSVQSEFAEEAERALKRLASSDYGSVVTSAKKAVRRLATQRAKERKAAERTPPPDKPVETSSPGLKQSTYTRTGRGEPVDGMPAPGSLKETSPREWDRIIRFISQGKLIPVLSNSLHIQQIFGPYFGDHRDDKSSFNGEYLTADEQLTREWARQIGYPMGEDHQLSRVIGYYLVEEGDSWAKADYINFLKQFLLRIAESDFEYSEVVGSMKDESKDMRFSEVVHRLDYPRLPVENEDSLRLLARLPLPIYVTTSYFDFLEQALIKEGKKPRTQICLWTGETDIKPEHSSDPSFRFTLVEPAVYHLYGFEDYPQTMVLSDDDYLNFLKLIASDNNTMEPVIPLRLRQAFAESSVLLLGYRQRDWDFRVLFNVLSNFRRGDFSPRGMMVKIPPLKAESANTERSLEYLRRYFDKYHFGVEWASADGFIHQLWKEWEKYRTGLK